LDRNGLVIVPNTAITTIKKVRIGVSVFSSDDSEDPEGREYSLGEIPVDDGPV